jgi:hypothetical protein
MSDDDPGLMRGIPLKGNRGVNRRVCKRHLAIGSILPDAQASRRQIQAIRPEHHSEPYPRRHCGLLEPPWASLPAPPWSGAWLLVCGPPVVVPTIPPVPVEPVLAPVPARMGCIAILFRKGPPLKSKGATRFRWDGKGRRERTKREHNVSRQV